MLARSRDFISLGVVKPAIRRYASSAPPCPPKEQSICPPCPPPCQIPCPPPPSGPYEPYSPQSPAKPPRPPFYHCPRNKYEVHWKYINDIPPATTMKDFFDRAAQICFWTELLRG